MTMTPTPRPLRTLALATAVAAMLACALFATGAAGHGRSRAGVRSTAHAASRYMVGIGDEYARMFGSPLWQQLHTKIARYIAPYDAVAHRDSLARATEWIAAAEAQHAQILVAFYHSEHTPTRLPSVGLYSHDVQKFIKRFPYVRQYQAWDEAKIGPTLEYIAEFKREIGRLRTVMPGIWGLHDYSDVNRLESWRTREVGRALGGQIWLTETGGIVQFGGAFPNRHGSGLSRAAKVLNYTLSLAASNSQIRRLYLYNWTGGVNSSRFDAGLTDARDRPRMGYVVVCRRLHGAK